VIVESQPEYFLPSQLCALWKRAASCACLMWQLSTAYIHFLHHRFSLAMIIQCNEEFGIYKKCKNKVYLVIIIKQWVFIYFNNWPSCAFENHDLIISICIILSFKSTSRFILSFSSLSYLPHFVPASSSSLSPSSLLHYLIKTHPFHKSFPSQIALVSKLVGWLMFNGAFNTKVISCHNKNKTDSQKSQYNKYNQ